MTRDGVCNRGGRRFDGEIGGGGAMAASGGCEGWLLRRKIRVFV